MAVALMLFFVLGLTIPRGAEAAVPDSLMFVRDKLNELVNGIEQCEKVIVTPDDLEFYHNRLEQLRDGRNRLQSQYPLSDYDELWNLVARFDNCDKRIAEHVAELDKKKARLVLIDKMNGYAHSFDSLLSFGKQYASRKSADSVRSVKLRAEDQWSKVNELKSSTSEGFDGDTLESIYKHIEKVRAEIQDLSDKEKMSPRELVLIIAVIVAALAMVLTLVRSITITKKSKNTPSIEI